MKPNNLMLDRIERDQQKLTRSRREERSRRRRIAVLFSLLAIGFSALAAPSLICHSPIGRSILTDRVAEFGFDATAESMRLGWITPLRINQLTLQGQQAGSELSIDQVDTELTILDLMGDAAANFGVVSLRGVNLKIALQDGRCSIEEDLNKWMQQPRSGTATTGTVNVHELAVFVSDTVTSETWQFAQANTTVDLLPDSVRSDFSGVLSQPRGNSGSLQGETEFGLGQAKSQWRLSLSSDALPLSVVSLARRRFPELAAQIPSVLRGDATGTIEIVGSENGNLDATTRQFEIRNLEAANPQLSEKLWTNQLAVLDGRLRLVDRRIMGDGLVAVTDFAKVKLDGELSRSLTWTGANDNPLSWLNALEGVATAELDLARFDHAMPGILPLRSNASLVSGTLSAVIESLPSRDRRRRRLSIQSDSLRARSDGQAVTITPIELTAIVSSTPSEMNAERFDLKSDFATATGQGDLEQGAADIQVDFGRLARMLRPIMNVSDSNLSGKASGKIRWSASGQDDWQLTGSADAMNLLVVLPNGKRLSHPSLRLDVDAIGTWDGKQLDTLKIADAKLSSTGFQLRAELVQAVPGINAETSLPIRMQGEGRLEELAGTFTPWLPSDLHELDGGFHLNARGEVSTSGGRLTSLQCELSEPRLAYGSRYFSQPDLKLQFDGELDPIHSALRFQSMTMMVGTAFSAAIQGEITPERTDLEIAWRAVLERVQGSVKTRLAASPFDRFASQRPAQSAGAQIAQVGYQSGQTIESDDWIVMGDCDGRFVITSREKGYAIETELTGKKVALVQPAAASAASQRMGPMPTRPGDVSRPLSGSRSRVVWAEPNLKVNGTLILDQTSGEVVTDSLKLACDWFATSLTGHMTWNAEQGQLAVKGPARIKMDEVATRLTQLTGTSIRAEGIQETPIELKVFRKPDEQIGISVIGNLGWEAAAVAGVEMGRAVIPVRLTETTVYVSPSTIPVGDGRLNLAGDVNYRPGPLWMRIEPGRVAESITVTPEMTNRWLKYLAPLASEATRISGTMGAELDEAIVIFDELEKSRVVGRLNIDTVQMNAGPMGNQMIGGLHQLKALASSMTPQAPQTNSTTLITMPAQTVDFMVDSGIVSHRRLFLDIDRANVITSGNVSLDGRLDMVAQVPLDSRWLGSDLQGLAGQSVSLPIDGTLSRPSLDSSGVRRVMTQLGTQTIQNTAENYLQKQLNKSIDKIFKW
ncbi:hypothetical protein Q31b_09620 [Novipirellula aureliae]|uniref:AsmA-like C-terminal domain-containing protein n=1 Tax=Novipirellula aureliae TaxID=2527966 RepID=A0A5C6EE19_9BACT|nr:hypothetical protein [Novipirellula aureliae]TWU45786.1 hypothetical protein Q31b_09620 [Novipirellula aureliae]